MPLSVIWAGVNGEPNSIGCVSFSYPQFHLTAPSANPLRPQPRHIFEPPIRLTRTGEATRFQKQDASPLFRPIAGEKARRPEPAKILESGVWGLGPLNIVREYLGPSWFNCHFSLTRLSKECIMRVTWLHRWLDRKSQPLANRPRPYRPFLEQLEVRDVPATFMVTTVTDVISSTDGVLSLREAIIAANSSVPRDLITFNIGTGLQTINLTSPLPTITHRVTIDGSSQPGYDPSNCNPVIELNGSGAGAGANGLWLGPGSGGTSTVPGSTIRGLAINLFAGDGILINTNFNRIVGNHIGTNSTGLVPLGNTLNGIEIQNGASNLIGGTICCSGNVISANQGNGILITAAAAIRNQVLGNYIGTDATGLAGLGNHQDGVKTAAAANKNTIGGTSLLARNLISGNLGDGIELGTTYNSVQENWIGVDVTGNAALPNLLDGVRVLVSKNTLTHNVISGNAANGVELLTGVQTTNIKGNMIGVNVQGNQPVGNTLDGIHLLTASANIIGGAGFGAGNVISGNTNGITLDGASLSNIIRGNFVGTDRTGTQKIKNTADGIVLNPSATLNLIGGSTLGAGNVVSGNGDLGIYVGSDYNTIQGNRIGTDFTGTLGLGNKVDGVYVNGGFRNLIGGSATTSNGGGPRNIIADNGRNGVVLRDGASRNMVQGNYIGVGLNGEH
ncbi:MAG TPA: hypothetical protein VHR66_14720, partial [Gemmataceae bacterium]|nr:hypothetical protein [Gemmataceae bacterium]